MSVKGWARLGQVIVLLLVVAAEMGTNYLLIVQATEWEDSRAGLVVVGTLARWLLFALCWVLGYGLSL